MKLRISLSSKFYQRASLIAAIVVWLIVNLLEILQLIAVRSSMDLGIPGYLPILLMDIFYLLIVVFFSFNISKSENSNFVDLLWRVFATGLIAAMVALGIQLFYSSLEGSVLRSNIFLNTFLGSLDKSVISVFLISTFMAWKKLILYQKNKLVVFFWKAFEAMVIASIFFDLTGFTFQNNIAFQGLFFAISILGIGLSGNLKWVAYLNTRQKWISILLILLVTIYLFYFFDELYVAPISDLSYVAALDSLFLLTLFTFLLFYSVFSILVILFNLPTSSVFERKMEEAINFQRLSQSVQTGENEDEIFEILLQSAMNTIYADAGWIELTEGEESKYIRKDISRVEISAIQEKLISSKNRTLLKNPFSQNEPDRVLIHLKKSSYKTALVVPLKVQNKVVGFMHLLNEIKDNYNKEMLNIIDTFVNQASISIENFKLLEEAIRNERYKEELNIAKKVQRALVPNHLAHDDNFSIHAFTHAATEVGGDYYDSYQLSDHRFSVVIGDVSGKGTSAAFHMSQMKGIYQSLVQLNLAPDEFLYRANVSLSQCLEKTSFITLSYFLIDTQEKQLQFARAGHCPSLVYRQADRKASYLQNKGLGLGILRNESFTDHIHVNELTYAEGDILLLFTDGISEAQNQKGDEFGYERLLALLEANASKNPEDIEKAIIDNLYAFCETRHLEDDYTLVVLKFN
mgnify:CR=1 FL=1